MHVITINEDNHGQIGIALNYYNAVKWLINEHWIDDDTEQYNFDTDEWETVKSMWGDNWRDLMLDQWNRNFFNEVWEGCFYLGVEEIIGTERED